MKAPHFSQFDDLCTKYNTIDVDSHTMRHDASFAFTLSLYSSICFVRKETRREYGKPSGQINQDSLSETRWEINSYGFLADAENQAQEHRTLTLKLEILKPAY